MRGKFKEGELMCISNYKRYINRLAHWIEYNIQGVPYRHQTDVIYKDEIRYKSAVWLSPLIKGLLC